MFRADDELGPYTLVRPIGRGAYGEVWLAERRSSLLTSRVALKLIDAGSTGLDAIRQEAQLWLNAGGHPNVLPVLDAEVYDGQPIIASEYVSGGTLTQWLDDHGGRSPDIATAMQIMYGILAGLAHLHQLGLVHRDLKPGNILMQSGVPRLADFGMARNISAGGNTESPSGTPAYMAPESFRGLYSAASDLWAGGIILHELITGAPPYAGNDFYAVMLAILSDQPSPISVELPEPVRAVLARALAKNVSDRFNSAGEFADALKQVESGIALSIPPAIQPTPHNLPAQTASFIGRQEQLSSIKRLLAASRLLTLTGPGGTGKSRLSVQAASDELTTFEHGVYFVELAPITEPALIPATVSSAIGIPEKSGIPAMRSLVESLKPRKLLLILDNCEHVLDGAATLVDELLRNCPLLRILASSRERLAVQGEQVYRVPPLTSPSMETAQSAFSYEAIAEYESVRLFTDRASLIDPGFGLSGSNANAIARICACLDGIPLAIELAAARIRVLPVEQLESRLDDRFRLLSGGSRAAMPRHRTLRALIDWSYDLLSEPERALLCRISVFMGGCTLDAVEQVCAAGEEERLGMLDVLGGLVEKSLVNFEQTGASARYRLQETVRQYGLERLAERNEVDATRERLVKFCLALIEEACRRLHGPEQGRWLDALAAEHDNIRAALSYCKTNPSAAEDGLLIAASMQQFWLTRGHVAEGREHLAALLQLPESHGPLRARARALNAAGTLAWMQGDQQAAEDDNRESLELWRALGDPTGIAHSLNNMGGVAHIRGDYAAARALYQESLDLRRLGNDKPGVAASLNNLGLQNQQLGDVETARTLFEESVQIQRELGDRSGLANSLGNLGTAVQAQGDLTFAERIHRESLELRRGLDDKRGIAIALSNLAVLAQVRGEHANALALHKESLANHRALGDKFYVTATLGNIGLVLCDQADYTDAQKYLNECLTACLSIESRYIAAFALEGRARVAHLCQQPRKAIRLYGAVRALRQSISSPAPPDEQAAVDAILAELRILLGEHEFEAQLADGESLTFEQVIALATCDI